MRHALERHTDERRRRTLLHTHGHDAWPHSAPFTAIDERKGEDSGDACERGTDDATTHTTLDGE